VGGLPDADGLGPGPEGGRQAAGCGHHVDDCAAHAAQGRNGCVCAWHNVDHRGTYAAQGCSGRARAGQDKRATGTARRTSLLWEYCCARASMGRVQSRPKHALAAVTADGQARLGMAVHACTGMQFWIPGGASFG